MKKFLTFVTAIVMGIACFGLTACGDKQNDLIGFDIDLARAVGEKLGLEVTFQEITWDTKEFELESGSIDVIWNGLTITEARLKEFEMTIPYMNNKQVAVIRSEDQSKYSTVESIVSNAAKMTAEKGSAGEDTIKAEFADLTYNGVSAQVDTLTELSSKVSDVSIMDLVLAKYYTGEKSSYFGKMIYVDLGFAPEQYGIAFKKGSLATVAKINETLAALYKDGTAKSIADKYEIADQLFTAEVTTDFDAVADKSDWNKIVGKKKLVVGYTIFAPIAFKK